jgi:ATP-dependent DNA ligase
MPSCGDSAVFYDRVVSDRRGAWYKAKQSDLEDFELVQVLPGNGGKFATSAGTLEVCDPATGTTSRVGSFNVNDQTRQFVYDHRDELAGAAVRIEVMEKNPSGTQRAGRFVDFHPDKNQSNDAIAAMQMA